LIFVKPSIDGGQFDRRRVRSLILYSLLTDE
jgi:hypothetical protein